MVRPLPHPPTSTSDLAPARPAGPQRWASLPKVRVSTDTSLLPPHALEPPTPSPLSPIPLSPTTANRRRLAKLRRKLGESLPPQAIYGGEEEGVMITTLEKITQHQPMLIVSDDESDSDSDSEPGTDDVDNAVVNHVAQNLGARLQRMGATLGTSQSALIRRCSRQWVREKGGRRWAEHDYQDVLRSLRQL
ncbi:hypothetical protein PLICRDRAFT_38544 [Plicaturopsis crispa FD-325 SS-3]|nr:hypothetical protein PLICRDRAFT_38544 [Plicaturopsis crispa FD-325 SS-3]